MRIIERVARVLAALTAGAPAMVALAADQAAAAANEASVWKQHQVSFDYYTESRSYNCQVLEAKVRQLMRQLRVREDLQVQASGCDAGTFSPSHMGTIKMTFSALAPSATNAAASSVPGHWVDVEISPQRSRFLDSGDCELIRSMQSVLSKELSWRGLEYDTSCFPRTVSINDFHIKGAVLEQSASTGG